MAQEASRPKGIIQSYQINLNNELEIDSIDWRNIKSHLLKGSKNDSIKISVNLSARSEGNLKFEKRYAVSGLRKNLTELIEKLKSLLA